MVMMNHLSQNSNTIYQQIKLTFKISKKVKDHSQQFAICLINTQYIWSILYSLMEKTMLKLDHFNVVLDFWLMKNLEKKEIRNSIKVNIIKLLIFMRELCLFLDGLNIKSLRLNQEWEVSKWFHKVVRKVKSVKMNQCLKFLSMLSPN